MTNKCTASNQALTSLLPFPHLYPIITAGSIYKSHKFSLPRWKSQVTKDSVELMTLHPHLSSSLWLSFSTQNALHSQTLFWLHSGPKKGAKLNCKTWFAAFYKGQGYFFLCLSSQKADPRAFLSHYCTKHWHTVRIQKQPDIHSTFWPPSFYSSLPLSSYPACFTKWTGNNNMSH